MSLTVKIINGSQVPYNCVVTVSKHLENLIKLDPWIILQLVEICQDENYQWPSQNMHTKTLLQQLGLVKHSEKSLKI